MKKILLFLILILFSASPAFSSGGSDWVSIEEYSLRFEDDYEEPKEEEPVEMYEVFEYEPEIKLKDKINLNSPEIIKPDNEEPLKLGIEKTRYVDSLRMVFEPITSTDKFYTNGKLSLFGEGSKQLSSYMTYNFKSSMYMSYALNKRLKVNAGEENWYVNADAGLGSRKFYLNPRLDITDSIYLDYSTRYNVTSKNNEQEIGINYKPKFLHDSASFGIKAGTTLNGQTGKKESSKLKFTTDFYF